MATVEMPASQVGGGDRGEIITARPQIGIDRLPMRRVGNEVKEAMNCKSCRKRKVGLGFWKQL